jgi:transforming growth factor-beta-induced protein
MSRAPRLAAALCALTLVVAACGDDDADTTPAATDAATDTTPAATEAAVETTEAAPETTEAAPETTEAASELGTVLDVAAEAGQFTTLLAAVDAAGLTETLSTRTEMTLLAPTDAAFEALGQATVDALLADPAALSAVLQGHVLAAPQDAATIAIFQNVLAINGASWDVVSDGATLTIGGATVVQADIMADNGIIHALDTVLVPAAAPAG